MDKMLEINDSVGMIIDVVERAALMNEDVLQDVLIPMECAIANNDFISVRMIAESDIKHARLKAEILDSLIEEITTRLQAIKNITMPTKVQNVNAHTEQDKQEPSA